MSWLSDSDEDLEPDDDSADDDDYVPSDHLSDMLDDMAAVNEETLSEEELDDMYDPTDLNDY